MKKNLLLFFSLISTFAFSQQAVKKVTPTQVYLLSLGNGSSLSDTCGPNNISYGNSGEGGTILVRESLATSNLQMTSSNYSTTTIANEIVGNTTYSNWFYPQQNLWSTQNNQSLSLSFNRKRGVADCNNDGQYDAIITIFDLPFTQTNGSAIPNGTKIRITSPTLKDLYFGGTLLASIVLWFEWQNTNWVSLTAAPNGVILPVLEDWGTFLNLNNIEELENLKIYPNPTNNNITIQNKEKSSESFEYKIIDLTGRIVKSGNSKFDEQISIESLTSGNYIIQIEIENNQKLTKKLIKY